MNETQTTPLFLLLGLAVAFLLGGGCQQSPSDREGAPEAEGRTAATYDSVASGPIPAAEGFRGLWYANQPSDDRYRYKYSGGLGTFPQQHTPIAVYAEAVDTTFFVYGGRPPDENRLLHVVSAYDHQTGTVARPRVLLDKGTDDAHDNPTLQIDDDGHLWIFSNAHGTQRPAYIHRSTEPYSIASFELVRKTNFSYGQPWHLDDEGFVFLHTHYRDGRRFLYVSRSAEGTDWTEPRLLARAAEGHYQISTARGGTVATAFNVHPEGKGLNWRTNLYYMASTDGGETWRTAAGDTLSLPITEPETPALAVEYASRDRLVYLKSMAITAEGRPVILYLTSNGYASGPENGPRRYHVARWTGSDWATHPVTTTDNNYDFASLSVGTDAWRIVGATEPGPQRYNTGGEIALWVSTDRGRTWSRERVLTTDSKWNHSYPRTPVGAQPDFFALWTDGHGRRPSDSRLYFTNRDGSTVRRLPPSVDSARVTPTVVK